MKKQKTKPNREHAYSRYMCVTEGLIDELQGDYFAGRDLGRSTPGMGATEAAIIVAESLEADHLWDTLPERLSGGAPPELQPERLSDWSLATMAELFFAVADLAKSQGNEERRRDYWALAWALLQDITESPTASPTLWYEDIFFDVGQELRIRGEREAIGFFKRALAHDLHHNGGNNADALLKDLAETYLWVGELDQGLRMFAALLHDDPSDIWTYNVIALSFGRFGLADLGVKATLRGLELIKASGDPDKLHDQFIDSLERLQESEDRGQEVLVDPAVLADLGAALAPDLNAGQRRPVVELCRELVPGLDRVPVKHPPEMPHLPPLEEFKEHQRQSPPKQKLGRNDPCWCGSGKKYKHCHLRSDRGH